MAAPYPLEHPDRRAIMAEVHARPVEILDGVARVRRLVFIIPSRPGAMEASFDRFAAYCATAGHPPPAPGTRQHGFVTAERQVTWEFHTEFVTITWRAALTDKENWPDDIGMAALGEAELLGGSRIDVIADTTMPQRLVPGFQLNSLCVVDVEDAAAQVATDFVPDADGYTRFEFAAGGLTPLRRSIIVRRLLEIDTYRATALLGLPVARQASPELRAIEAQLTTVVEALPGATSTEAVQAALIALHTLSVQSGQLSERLDYRFAASHAYGEILRARLDGLHEGATTQGSSLSRYIANRVEPALATCTAIEKRIKVLADKVERAIGLLDVRIGLDLQVQNKSVLDTIARTAQSQFQLQATVEGLSVIAISYYLLGVISYILAGPLEYVHFDKALSLSIAAPFAVLFVWMAVRSVRRRHITR